MNNVLTVEHVCVWLTFFYPQVKNKPWVPLGICVYSWIQHRWEQLHLTLNSKYHFPVSFYDKNCSIFCYFFLLNPFSVTISSTLLPTLCCTTFPVYSLQPTLSRLFSPSRFPFSLCLYSLSFSPSRLYPFPPSPFHLPFLFIVDYFYFYLLYSNCPPPSTLPPFPCTFLWSSFKGNSPLWQTLFTRCHPLLKNTLLTQWHPWHNDIPDSMTYLTQQHTTDSMTPLT